MGRHVIISVCWIHFFPLLLTFQVVKIEFSWLRWASKTVTYGRGAKGNQLDVLLLNSQAGKLEELHATHLSWALISHMSDFTPRWQLFTEWQDENLNLDADRETKTLRTRPTVRMRKWWSCLKILQRLMLLIDVFEKGNKYWTESYKVGEVTWIKSKKWPKQRKETVGKII